MKPCKIGVVCDNYKLDLFKSKLNDKKFKFEIFKFTDNSSTIKIYTYDFKKKEVEIICKEVEFHFKRSN